MAFNDTLPLQIHDLRTRISTNNRKISDLNRQLIAELHECNCEFCDYEDPYDAVDEDLIEADIKAIKAENDLIDATIGRLKLYAKDHNIELGND